MNKLAELRAKLEAQKAEAATILGREDENGVLSAEDDAAYVKLEAEMGATKAKITAAELSEQRKHNLGSTSAIGSLPALDGFTREPDPRTTGGFHTIAEFANAVRMAQTAGGIVDTRLIAGPASPHQGVGGSNGEGFDVPAEFRDRIWTLVSDLNPVFDLCDVEPTQKPQVKLSADESTPWGASGVQAYWRAEAKKMTETNLDTEGRNVTVHDLYAFITATEELLSDSPRLASRLENKAAAAIMWKIDEATINGSGVGQPMGWRRSKALVKVDKEAGQAADTIVSENLLKMFSRFITVPGDKPLWLANSNTLPALAHITIGDKPVWIPGNGLEGAPNGTLLGYPLRFDEHAETLGDEGDLQLVSPKGYYGARRQGAQFASSIHLFFDQNIEAFRWTVRLGGQPHLSKPVTPAKSAETKSHFVSLAARA